MLLTARRGSGVVPLVQVSLGQPARRVQRRQQRAAFDRHLPVGDQPAVDAAAAAVAAAAAALALLDAVGCSALARGLRALACAPAHAAEIVVLGSVHAPVYVPVPVPVRVPAPAAEIPVLFPVPLLVSVPVVRAALVLVKREHAASLLSRPPVPPWHAHEAIPPPQKQLALQGMIRRPQTIHPKETLSLRRLQ